MPKKYPDEFKVKAIRRYEKGESIQSLCQELHISQSTLYHWRREYCSIQTATHTYTPKEFDSSQGVFKKRNTSLRSFSYRDIFPKSHCRIG